MFSFLSLIFLCTISGNVSYISCSVTLYYYIFLFHIWTWYEVYIVYNYGHLIVNIACNLAIWLRILNLRDAPSNKEPERDAVSVSDKLKIQMGCT